MNNINPRRAVERCAALAKLGSPPPWWRVWKLRRWLSAYRSIMALDISVHAEMLRETYTDEKLRELATAPNPFVKVFTKSTGERSPMGRWVDPVVGRVTVDPDHGEGTPR